MKRTVGKALMALGILWALAGILLVLLAYVSAYTFAHAPYPDLIIAVPALALLFLLPGWILYRIGRRVSLGKPVITLTR